METAFKNGAAMRAQDLLLSVFFDAEGMTPMRRRPMLTGVVRSRNGIDLVASYQSASLSSCVQELDPASVSSSFPG